MTSARTHVTARLFPSDQYKSVTSNTSSPELLGFFVFNLFLKMISSYYLISFFFKEI